MTKSSRPAEAFQLRFYFHDCISQKNFGERKRAMAATAAPPSRSAPAQREFNALGFVKCFKFKPGFRPRKKNEKPQPEREEKR